AVRKGDHYIVSGQKIWTTLAQHADWIFCLVRTDPAAKKQLGISYIVFEMKQKGVTVRPIQTIDGSREVNEVFFDDVKVPVENLIGEENRGWDCAKFLLGNERTGIARVGASKLRVRRIKELARKVSVGEGTLWDDMQFRERVAAVEVELKALEMTQMRVLAAEKGRRDGKPNPASSILKIKGTEIQQATTELLMHIAGPFAVPFASDEEAFGHNEQPFGPEWAAATAPTYFNYRKTSIYGGSNEIQRNIIAKAVLGF
ncbi:MAG TPA: acyl-CoA dehydrogenase family protein, partial [Hyphomicrobiaceae bacterium]|nr:acyl-CoA dehydrogenase family protein [Hyphomicrobiaceae bacterium]